MDIDQLAKRQLSDYDRHVPGGLFAGYSIAMTVEEAYALQFAVARLRMQRGEPVAGYKVGCISPVMQAQLQLDRPVFGHVFGSAIRTSGAALDAADFDGLAIEGKFCVRIARDISDANWLRKHPNDAISVGLAVIELHNYVFRNTSHNAQELIGNNAIHAGVVLPVTETALTDPSVLLDTSIRVSRNGVTLGTANGRALPEGPFSSLIKLAEHLAGFGLILWEGQIVLTGSPLPLYRVAEGDLIEVSCDRSEMVSCLISEAKRLGIRWARRMARNGISWSQQLQLKSIDNRRYRDRRKTFEPVVHNYERWLRAPFCPHPLVGYSLKELYVGRP